MLENQTISQSAISAENKMYREIANEAADAIYVIDQKSYQVLYYHETKQMFPYTGNCIGKKCYEALQGLSSPCAHCNFKKGSSGEACEVKSQWNDRVYRIYFRETDWNGIPAFIQYLRDITGEVETRNEKLRLEQYFQTLVESLPGGVVVIRCRKDETYTPEFLSAGFAEMIGATLEQAWEMYSRDALAGVHPDDIAAIREQLREAFAHTERRYELTYRLMNGKGGYIWVRNTLSMLPSEGGDLRQYCYLRDITQERREQEQIRRQYRNLIVQHYRTPGPNAIAVGHCNITRDKILEVNDFTTSGCIKCLGTRREDFFTSFSELIVKPEDKQKFLATYLNAPMMAAYRRRDTQQLLSCLIQLPDEETGRYVQCKVNLVEEPDTGDITGILTVTDITEQVIAEQVLQRLSSTGYDYIIVLDLQSARFNIFTSDHRACCVPPKSGSHYAWMDHLLDKRILPKDRENYKNYLDLDYIARRLEEKGAYYFDFSIIDDEGNIRVKRMNVFAIDMPLGKVGLSRTDVTETVREQQGLLNMLAYTFELAGFIDMDTGRLVMHTRQTVLEDLSPYVLEAYDEGIREATEPFGRTDQEREEIRGRLHMAAMLEALEKSPAGFDFVCAYRSETGLQYKKINILWGDRDHRTICIVQADVTEMLATERKNKQELEKALRLAEQANQAKTSFLSSMSHDIRTPMNAIMGMTALAAAHPDNPDYVMECLNKISSSSRHLLNLINDVLDMSKIEHAKIELNRECLSMTDMMEQVAAMVRPQAGEKGLQFQVAVAPLTHGSFYGDSLRINQILINILGNAVKFTPEGGRVRFGVTELSAVTGRVRYCFSIEDTGIGMSEEMIAHVFEPFTRGAHVGRVEGTGLGLSITKGLIERMGGTISVKSREGAGSQFFVELEFDAAAKTLATGAQKPAQPWVSGEDTEFLNGCRFLIAEDNEINSEILESLLEMYGAASVVTTDGEQAVRAFCAAAPGNYAAVLMDIQMPVKNGYEAAMAIRALDREDARTIPIIAMTANAFAEDVQSAMDAGMNAHVAKPIDMEILKSTLRRVLLQGQKAVL